MKSKKIDKLRYEDYDGIESCLNFFLFLELFNIKSASDPAEEFECVMEEFCPECKVIKDDCDCRGQHDYDHGDSDRAYDEWKDRQIEEKYDKEFNNED